MATHNIVHGHRTLAHAEHTAPPGRTLPQSMGHYLWGPMTAMGAMLIGTAFVLALIRANISTDFVTAFDAGEKANFETLGQLVPGFMFLGMGFVLGGISLAIARILGVFAVGGGRMQALLGEGIKAPKMPLTAKLMLVGMTMALMTLMTLMFAFGGHVYAAVQAHEAWSGATSLGTADAPFLGRAETWGTWLAGLRFLGIGLFLGSIALGLLTITDVIRFQALRIRELGATAPAAS